MALAFPTTTLHFAGALTVPNADEIHTRLIAALEDHKHVVLDLSAATEIDVSFIQIIVAAQKTASAKQIEFAIRSEGFRLLMDEAARCGLSATANNGTRVLPPIALDDSPSSSALA